LTWFAAVGLVLGLGLGTKLSAALSLLAILAWGLVGAARAGSRAARSGPRVLLRPAWRAGRGWLLAVVVARSVFAALRTGLNYFLQRELDRAADLEGQARDGHRAPARDTAGPGTMTERDLAMDPSRMERERWPLVQQLQLLLEGPVTALGFIWLGLLVLDLTTGLPRSLQLVSYGIWVQFVLDFLLRLAIAPSKAHFLRRNWLTVVSLLLPAPRVLRIFRAFGLLRAARATRSGRLLRLITALNRGMGALGASLGRRGVGYVALPTVIVTITGAAGIATFEHPAAMPAADSTQPPTSVGGLDGYGEALWWTAIQITTLGSEYWPRTPEGRILTFLLALYAFAIFVYLTATIASYFVGQDQAATRASAAVDQTTLVEPAALRNELAALRAELAARPLQASPPETSIPSEQSQSGLEHPRVPRARH
jgi:voltage-gated potassium channel